MKSVGPYLQEVKDEIISRYRQSGLSQKKFCESPEVPITSVTLRKWLKKAGCDRSGIVLQEKQTQPAPELNIVCYNIGKRSVRSPKEGEEELSLQEMVAFQQEVHDLCLRLYHLDCSREGITLLSRIKGVL
jgi:transposase-like protein